MSVDIDIYKVKAKSKEESKQKIIQYYKEHDKKYDSNDIEEIKEMSCCDKNILNFFYSIAQTLNQSPNKNGSDFIFVIENCYEENSYFVVSIY